MKKLILLLLPLSLFAQKKALFLGNSYTSFNQLPSLVAQIAHSLGDSIIVDSNTPGGAKLEDHAQSGSTSLQKIRQDQWDFVVLQAQSQEPSFPPLQVQQQTYPYAQMLVDSIRHNHQCTDPLFFMTWGRKYGDTINGAVYPIISTYEGMQQRLRESYLEMGNDNDAMVAPVGMAWQQIVEQYPNIELYTGDGSHPSLQGSYLAACVFYSVMFEKSTVDSITFVPNAISQDIATILQTVASNTVLDSTDTWNMFYVQSIDTTQIDNQTYQFSVQSTHYDSITWFFEADEYAYQQSATHTFSQEGNYTVNLTLTANGGCREKVFSYEISIDSSDTSVAITHPMNDGNLFALYPSPVNQYLTIEGAQYGTRVKIYDYLGRLLLNTQVIDNANEHIELSNLENGYYIVEISNQEKRSTYKILKSD